MTGARDLLAQHADGFRVAACRRAAGVVAGLSRSVAEVLATEGREGLIALPGIGGRIASALRRWQPPAIGRGHRNLRKLWP
jgi:hypothetical protein